MRRLTCPAVSGVAAWHVTLFDAIEPQEPIVTCCAEPGTRLVGGLPERLASEDVAVAPIAMLVVPSSHFVRPLDQVRPLDWIKPPWLPAGVSVSDRGRWFGRIVRHADHDGIQGTEANMLEPLPAEALEHAVTLFFGTFCHCWKTSS